MESAAVRAVCGLEFPCSKKMISEGIAFSSIFTKSQRMASEVQSDLKKPVESLL
jgi:hypothetical protein